MVRFNKTGIVKKKKIKKKTTTQATTEIVLTYEQGLGIKSTMPL